MCFHVFAQNMSGKLEQPYRITPRANNAQHIDLTGDWELSYMDNPIASTTELKNRKDAFETQVPNSVHWSYFKQGNYPILTPIKIRHNTVG